MKGNKKWKKCIKMKNHGSDRLKFALTCAKRGWLVFPLYSIDRNGRCTCVNPACNHPGKHPKTQHGFKDATRDRKMIVSWWHDDPEANIGICTGVASGIVVLDVDPRHDGEESLRNLERNYGPLPSGPCVKTGGGGWHYYFLHPGSSAKISNKTSILPGIDVRADGGYVVGRGSVHQSGKKYTWVEGETPEDLPVPPFPEWLCKILLAKPAPATANSAVSAIPEGERNSRLTSLAGALQWRGADPATIRAALLTENERRCKPPLPESEVQSIVSSISKYEPRPIHSAPYTEVVRAEKVLRFQTTAEIAVTTPETVDWIVRPWVAAGSITDVDAKVKIGKTTWVMHMIRSTLDGLPFMGEPTVSGPAVYLTEQPMSSFRQALERAGLLGRDDLSVLVWHETIGVPWENVAHAAIDECKRKNARLLVIDTIAQFARLHGDAENNAGNALLAMQPLQEAAGAGLGVIMVRHERKSGGDVGDSGRGSSAFAGAVDTIISIRRQGGNTRPTLRQINAVSRFSETPDEMMIELTPNGYVSHGSVEAVAIEEATRKLAAEAPTDPKHAKTLDKLIEIAKVPRTTAQRAIEGLQKAGKLCRAGSGNWASPEDSAQTPIPVGQNEIGSTNDVAETTCSDAGESISGKMLEARKLLKQRLARQPKFPGAANPGSLESPGGNNIGFSN
jgi:hypothetical protein